MPQQANHPATARYSGIKWVWFDIDDTIVDFSLNSRQSMAIIYNRTPLLQRLFSDADQWIQVYERHNKALWEQFNNGLVQSDFLRLQRFIGPLTEVGCRADEAAEAAAILDPLYLDTLAAQPGVIDGAPQLIAALHDAGYHIGVLSNGFRGVQEKKLVTAGVDHLVECVVLSDDIGINKPDARIFQHAMSLTDCPDATAHLMIGDNPTTDIAGAVGAGWQAIHLDPERHFSGSFRHRVTRVDNMWQAKALLTENYAFEGGNA